MNAPGRAQCPRLLELWDSYFAAVDQQSVAVQHLVTEANEATGNHGELLVAARKAGEAARRARIDIKNHRAECGC